MPSLTITEHGERVRLDLGGSLAVKARRSRRRRTT
jgi:hypothetical protein